MRKIIIYIIILTGFSVQGQVYNFRTFSLEQGLAQSQVYDFCQDKNGFMWIATYSGGISVYSGFETSYFNVENGLPGNYVISLHAATNGDIWIGTTEGLAYYNGSDFKIVKDEKNLLSGTTIWDICEDAEGAIWIASNKGLWIYKDQQIELFSEFADDVVYLVYTDREGVIWIHSSHQGVVLYKNQTFQFDQFPQLESVIVNTYYADQENNMWIGTSDGLFKYCKDTSLWFTVKDGLPSNNAYSVVEDDRGRIWVGTYGEGLCLINNKLFQVFTEENGLCLNKINRLFIDDQQNLWIGSDGGGASILKNHSFAYVPFDKQAGKTLIMSLLCDSKGNTWMGSESKGLIKLKDNKRTLFGVWNGLTNNTVNALFEDSEETIWVGTDEGLNKIIGNRVVDFPGKDSLLDKTIMTIEEYLGNMLIGTNGDGLWMVDKKGCYPVDHEYLNDNAIWKIYKSTQGILYYATEEGFIVHDGLSYKLYTEEDGLTDRSVWALEEDGNGNIWIGSDNGLNRFDGKSFINYTTKEGLTSGTIYILKFDIFSRFLWVGSEKGVDKIEVDKDGKLLSVQNYSKEEGFSSIECNSNAVSINHAGDIWFGTIDGAIVYNPDEQRYNLVPPKIHITNVKLFYEEVNWKKYGKTTPWFNTPVDLKLDYDQNTLTIEFAAINFSNPENVKYKYMLEGLDVEWAPITKKNYERYSNLPPGDYTFKVLACNDDGVWSDTPATFSFHISPPFWKTIWFISLVIIIGALLIFGYISLRTRKLKRSKEVLSKMVRERTYEIVIQKEEIDEKRRQLELAYKDITDSVKYAQRIQKAIMPEQTQFQKLFPESFILLKPKDIVSGDFYWFDETADTQIVAAVDCTGHGVPGAFMSLIGHDLLDQIIAQHKETQPAKILSLLDQGITSLLHHSVSANTYVQDGMDLALCTFHKSKRILEYAGSYRPLYLIRNDELLEIKGDKFTAGGYYRDEKKYTNHKLTLQEGDCIYIFSDGYADQFGGEKGMKFMVKKFKKTLLSIHHLTMKEQREELSRIFAEWKESYEQIDDVLIIGIKVV